MLAPLGRSQAIIEFTLDGTIINANDNFLTRWLQARHQGPSPPHVHGFNARSSAGMFPLLGLAALRRKYQTGEYKRIGAANRTIWNQASYNPILDGHSQTMKGVKLATDITAIVQQRLVGDIGNLGDDADGFKLGGCDRQGHWRDGGRHVVGRKLDRTSPWKQEGLAK